MEVLSCKIIRSVFFVLQIWNPFLSNLGDDLIQVLKGCCKSFLLSCLTCLVLLHFKSQLLQHNEKMQGVLTLYYCIASCLALSSGRSGTAGSVVLKDTSAVWKSEPWSSSYEMVSLSPIPDKCSEIYSGICCINIAHRTELLVKEICSRAGFSLSEWKMLQG